MSCNRNCSPCEEMCPGTFTADFLDEEELVVSFGEITKVNTGNYNDLFNKPSINEVELVGNKSFEELGDSPLTNIEIKSLFDRVFGG